MNLHTSAMTMIYCKAFICLLELKKLKRYRMRKSKIVIGILAVLLLVAGIFYAYTEWIGPEEDVSRSDNVHLTFTASGTGNSENVSYEIDTLWVGEVPLFFPGYKERASRPGSFSASNIVPGWNQQRPGTGISMTSIPNPFDDPIVSAVVFDPGEPVANDPERLLLLAHKSTGVSEAPVLERGEFEGDDGRRSWYSVVKGPMDNLPEVISVSGVVVADGSNQSAVGIIMDGPDAARERIVQSIDEIAEALVL